MIGAQKCGTTTVANILLQHPQIRGPSCANIFPPHAKTWPGLKPSATCAMAFAQVAPAGTRLRFPDSKRTHLRACCAGSGCRGRSAGADQTDRPVSSPFVRHPSLSPLRAKHAHQCSVRAVPCHTHTQEYAMQSAFRLSAAERRRGTIGFEKSPDYLASPAASYEMQARVAATILFFSQRLLSYAIPSQSLISH